MAARATVIIPARFGSTRFPGKPLACETGKPLIQHTVEQVMKAGRVGSCCVATDDDRIGVFVATGVLVGAWVLVGTGVLVLGALPAGCVAVGTAVAG